MTIVLMGIREYFGYGSANTSTQVGVLSPWAEPSALGGVIVSEALRTELEKLPTGREAAMTVPAVARGRHLLVASIAQLPLAAVKDGTPLPNQPLFLSRTDSMSGVAPAERIARTVDSLIFHGRALWAVKRGSKNEVLDAAWIPNHRWSIDRDNKITVDGNRVQEGEVILFVGYTDGLLNTAQRTIDGAIRLEEGWVSRASNPIPITVIRHQIVNGQQPAQLAQEDITTLLNQWSTARRNPDGALGYLPPELMLDTHGEIDPALFVEGRNAIRVDIASHLGIPASLLDGSVAEASLTYTTTEGNANRFWTETLPLYLGPIENALTAQATPAGTQVRFFMPELLTNPGSPIGAPEPVDTTAAPEPITPAPEETPNV